MFEIPNAKRVKRSKLFSSFSSSEDEANDGDDNDTSKYSDLKSSKTKKTLKTKHTNDDTIRNTTLHSDDDTSEKDQNDTPPPPNHYGFEYEFIDKAQPNQNSLNLNLNPTTTNDDDKSTQQYAFNLFNPTPTLTKQNLITLRSPTPPPLALLPNPLDTTHGRILHARPDTYYFTTAKPTSTLQSEYLTSAVSGTFIQTQSLSPWPGTHLPWRVLRIPSTRAPPITPDPERCSGTAKRVRTRPSKKRRIAIRQRAAARVQAREAATLAEEAEREKRTRRNREKKVKRKAREKAKKAEKAGGFVDGDGQGDDGDGDSSGEDD